MSPVTNASATAGDVLIPLRALADPTHPAHAAFKWGLFFSILSTALAIAAPEVEIFGGNKKIIAAITAATPALGSLGAAFQE